VLDATGDRPWPFLGRSEELATVLRRASQVGGVGITGPSGIGKTSLLRAVGDRFAGTALRIAGNGPDGALATLAPLTSGDAEVFGAAQAGLLEHASPVLLVDDAHRLDTLSAAFVEWAAERVPVVLATDSAAALPAALTRLRRSAPERWLELVPLSEVDVEQLLASRLGGAVDGLSAAEVHESSGGVPLLLRELVTTAQRCGAFAQRHGVWMLRWQDVSLAGFDSASTLLAGLDQESRAALEVLACGSPLPVGALFRLPDQRSLATLERLGLIGLSGPAEAQVASVSPAVVGHVVRAGLGAVRRRQVYAELANCAAGLVELERQAVWALRGGVEIDTAKLVRAGWQAARYYRLDTAESLARSAIDAGGGWPGRHLLASVLAQRRSAGTDSAVRSAMRSAGSPVEQARSAVTAVESLYWNAGHRDAAFGESARLPGESPDAAALRAVLAMFDGRPLDALHTTETAPDGAEPGAAARLTRVAVFAAVAAGRPDEALAMADRGIARLSEQDKPWREWWLRWGQCQALTALGRLTEVAELASAGYRDGIRLRIPELAGGWALSLGILGQLHGRLEDAQRHLRESAALFGDHDPLRFASICLLHLASVLAQAGELIAAQEALDTARAEHGANQAWLPIGLLAAAWIAHGRGERAEAVRLALRAAEQSRAGGDHNTELPALHAVARFGAPERALSNLDTLVTRMRGPWAPLFYRHAQALAAQDAAGLATVAADFQRSQAFLLAAEAGRSASAAYRAAGRLGSAIAAKVAAESCLDSCGRPRVSTLPAEYSSPLTPREEEVVALAAVGWASRPIADHLGLSVRTVDNHLGNAYRKLGVPGRHALSAAR
jgi:DNA-binding CsgD family transcriptional regulator